MPMSSKLILGMSMLPRISSQLIGGKSGGSTGGVVGGVVGGVTGGGVSTGTSGIGATSGWTNSNPAGAEPVNCS